MCFFLCQVRRVVAPDFISGGKKMPHVNRALQSSKDRTSTSKEKFFPSYSGGGEDPYSKSILILSPQGQKISRP